MLCLQFCLMLSESASSVPVFPVMVLFGGPCTVRPPYRRQAAVGNCYSESWISGATLINKVFISHFP